MRTVSRSNSAGRTRRAPKCARVKNQNFGPKVPAACPEKWDFRVVATRFLNVWSLVKWCRPRVGGAGRLAPLVKWCRPRADGAGRLAPLVKWCRPCADGFGGLPPLATWRRRRSVPTSGGDFFLETFSPPRVSGRDSAGASADSWSKQERELTQKL